MTAETKINKVSLQTYTTIEERDKFVAICNRKGLSASATLRMFIIETNNKELLK